LLRGGELGSVNFARVRERRHERRVDRDRFLSACAHLRVHLGEGLRVGALFLLEKRL
jgi:hypothetical protein